MTDGPVVAERLAGEPPAAAGEGAAPPRWRLMSRFVLRSTGFPFDWLERLRVPGGVAAAERLLATRRRRQALREEFLAELFPALCDQETAAGRDRATFRFWYRLAREVRRGNPVGEAAARRVAEVHGRADLAGWLQGWDETGAELERLRAEAERVLAAELTERRAALRELAAQPRVQEALWLSNPSFHEVGWSWLQRHDDLGRRPSKARHLERRLYAYLQRLCAKNDTTSFFGPLNYGAFAPVPVARCRRAGQPLRRRRAFLAYWAVDALARRIAAAPELRPYLAPRRAPTRLGAPPAAAPQALALHASCDGERTVAELAAELGQPLERALAAAEALAEAGWLELDLQVPPSALDPLGHLTERLRRMPAACAARRRWLARLDGLRREVERFAGAGLGERQRILRGMEARWPDLAGAAPRRGEGRMFADRLLLYEECLGDVEELALTEADRERVAAALAPVASLAATYSARRLEDWRAAARALFDGLSPDGAPVPFVRFAAAWRRRHPEPPAAPSAERLLARLTELVGRGGGAVRALSAADLQALCEPPREPVLLSPDLLLDAPDLAALAAGRWRLVVGELHHGAQPVGWMQVFVDDAEQWRRELTAHLPGPDGALPANLVFRRRAKTAPPEHDGASVQVSAVARGRPRLDLADLQVVAARGGLELRAADGTGPLRFYPPSYGVPMDAYAPFALFSYLLVEAPPVSLGRHTPRIEVDGTVYQRERWEVPAAELPGLDRGGSPLRLLAASLELRRRLGLPERVYARTAAEPKPVFIDFHNFFALELLAQLAGHAETVRFEEMLPGPCGLWLRGAEGGHCAELRTVLSAGGRGGAGAAR